MKIKKILKICLPVLLLGGAVAATSVAVVSCSNSSSTKPLGSIGTQQGPNGSNSNGTQQGPNGSDSNTELATLVSIFKNSSFMKWQGTDGIFTKSKQKYTSKDNMTKDAKYAFFTTNVSDTSFNFAPSNGILNNVVEPLLSYIKGSNKISWGSEFNRKTPNAMQLSCSYELDFNSKNDAIFKNWFGKSCDELKLENQILFNGINKIKVTLNFNAKDWQNWNGIDNAPLFHITFDGNMSFNFGAGKEVSVNIGNNDVYLLSLIGENHPLSTYVNSATKLVLLDPTKSVANPAGSLKPVEIKDIK